MTADISDPVANAIEHLLEHILKLKEQVEAMQEAMQEHGIDINMPLPKQQDWEDCRVEPGEDGRDSG